MSKLIAIDAGHGMKTAGKRCMKAIDPNETREWYLNDRIADRVQSLLKAYDCKTIRVDDTTGAKDIPLATRVATANNAGADIYISFHHDAGISGGSGGGTTVYWYNDYDGKGKETAWDFYNAVVGSTGLSGNRSGKVLRYGFYVIKYTKMPAFLIENGFMDSTTDTPIILTKEHAEKTAQGALKFLVSELGLKMKASSSTVAASETSNENGNRNCYPAYAGKQTTLVAALTSLGIDSSYSNRTKIAKANGISGYVGSYAQNTEIYNLLVAGELKKVGSTGTTSKSYSVRVSINNLNIRKGPGTQYAKNGTIKPGVYTIVAESSGNGATKWGKLKSGAGWISLDYVKEI